MITQIQLTTETIFVRRPLGDIKSALEEALRLGRFVEITEANKPFWINPSLVVSLRETN